MASKMTKLGKQSGFEVLALGDLFYLMLPTVPTNRVIITCHGGHTLLSTTNQFSVPKDSVLRFYSDDTNSVIDPGFNNFYKKEAVPKEIISEGDRCFDYVLSKYQGSHGNKNETYDSISKVVNDAVKWNKKFKADAAKAPNAKIKNSLLNSSNKEKVSAVLTVRNRWFKGDARLSNAVKLVKEASGSIEIFDCLFCRSTMFGGSDKVKLVSRN